MFQGVGAELRGHRCRKRQTGPKRPVQPSYRSRSQAGCPTEHIGLLTGRQLRLLRKLWFLLRILGTEKRTDRQTDRRTMNRWTAA